MLLVLLSSSLAVNRLSAQSDFCGGPLGTTFNGQNISSYTGTWSNITVTVTGILTIDQSTTCSYVNFQMNPGSSIRVASGKTFTVSNSTFRGCVTVWSGILVQSGGTIKLSQCNVKDALIGIRFEPGFISAQSELSGVGFRNNITGIAALNFPSSAPFKLKIFSGNTFGNDGPNALLMVPPFLPPSYQSSYTSTFPLRGIWIANGAADLSNGASAPNNMSNLRYGIVASEATVTVTNCRFNGITNALSTDPYDGSAIYAQRSSVIVSGEGNANCRFFNSGYTDVYSRSTRGLNVARALFTAPTFYGIRVTESGFNANIDISNNTFEMDNLKFVSAIYAERPPGSTDGVSVNIVDNQITVPQPNHIKNAKVIIDVVGKFKATDFVRVERCTINVNATIGTYHGIRIAGLGNNFKVESDNVLSYATSSTPTTTLNSYGIVAQDLLGTFNSVSYNHITSALSGSNSFLHAGIHAEHNKDLLEICENTLTNTHKGIECKAALLSTYLRKNLFGAAAYGLWCSSSAAMSDQDRFENRWTASSYAVLGAKYDVSTPVFTIFRDITNSITDDQPPSSSWSPSTWFQALVGSNGNCGVSSFVPAITGKERDFINGTTTADTATANWDARRDLFYKLKTYADLTARDVDAANYLSGNSSTAPWKYAEAQRLFDVAYTISDALNTQFSTLRTQYALLADSLLLWDGLQAADTSTYDLTIAQTRTNTFGRWSIVADSLIQKNIQVSSTLQTGLQTALTYVAALPTTGKIYETNLKDLLGVMVHYAQGGDSLVVGDSTLLRNIAAQCQRYGGSSIRLAPLWLQHIEGVRYIGKDWDVSCTAGLREQAAVAIPTAKVLPNPVTNVAQIVFSDDTAGQWMISDLAGRVVQNGTWTLTDNQATINTVDWKAGLYFLGYQSANGSQATTKFVVVH